MRYYLGLGSNVGDRLNFMQHAVEGLQQFGTVEKKSPLYESEPFGVKEQDTFYNAVIIYNSNLDLAQLITKIKNLEKQIGRQDRPRWHAREIDIDILDYDGPEVQTEQVTVPHPGLEKRNFVLYPLRDVAPYFCNRQKTEMNTLIEESQDGGKVKKIKAEW
jgi:2-amino-4-hydroxy-6-hydroxymethyldihydropteridine diphosphokinase